jgi:hypothetical protein
METRGRRARRWVALAAGVAWDLLEARRLARSPDLRLGPRLLADLVDVAAWSAVSGRAYAAVPILGAPLITETAFRYQWAAAPLVLAHLVAVAGARRLADKPVRPANLGYQVIALVCGMGLRGVERATVERIRTTFEAELSAAENTAMIAGQYRVARSAYEIDGERLNPHDVLSGIRLHFPSARDEATALHDLTWGGRKSTLEALAAERAVQLDTAIRGWKRDTNANRSALADQILELTLPESHGLVLLSGEQVAELGRALRVLPLRGAITAGVLEATRPGARIVLQVSGMRVVLPPDPPRLVVVRADPTPVAMLQGGILWALLEATEAADAAPPWSTLPGALTFGIIALWSRRALRERGEGAHPALVSLSAMGAVVQASFVHLAIRGRPNRPDGSQRVPMQVALTAPAVVTGFCWPSLRPGGRRRTAVLFAAILGVGFLLLERPRWRRDLSRYAIWLPTAFLPSLAYRLSSERDAERAKVELHRRQSDAADAAARRGEKSEWQRVLRACDEGLRSIDSVHPAARSAVERRLRVLYRLAEEHSNAYE